MFPVKKPVFENRRDAGKKLAEKLPAYKGTGTLVLGIPNGGLPTRNGSSPRRSRPSLI